MIESEREVTYHVAQQTCVRGRQQQGEVTKDAAKCTGGAGRDVPLGKGGEKGAARAGEERSEFRAADREGRDLGHPAPHNVKEG